MAYGICSYPVLSDADYNLIQDFRKEYDELYYSVVEPHFSFVFPVFDITKEQFLAEARNKSKAWPKIDFEIKCATVNKDAVLDYFHLLLVPDKGYSDIVKLHDHLYSDIFFENLRLDIDFIPHIGIANSTDKYKVKKWADNWNKTFFSIKGTITTLTVVDYTDNVLTDLEKIHLC